MTASEASDARSSAPRPNQTHRLRVARIVQETDDARSFILEIPVALAETFRYRAGQFLTFKIPFDGAPLVRAYSLASSPEWESEHKITVKRVADGRISNWLHDNVRSGDVLEVLPPAGLFTLSDTQAPLCFFAAGSGITPIISLIKTALRTTGRTLTLVYANRDRAAVIFREELDRLAGAYADRLSLVQHLDVDNGLFSEAAASAHARADAEFYICGPTAFMDTVERVLAGGGVAPERIHIERFVSPPDGSASVPATAASAEAEPCLVDVHLDGRAVTIQCAPGETILASVQRAGLQPPFSCTEGFCGCCMAQLKEGRVQMRRNDFLSPRELEDGWVLTCQSLPTTRTCRVDYPD